VCRGIVDEEGVIRTGRTGSQLRGKKSQTQLRVGVKDCSDDCRYRRWRRLAEDDGGVVESERDARAASVLVVSNRA
jgi:hypothetical protein